MTDTEARNALADELLRSKLHTLSHATNFNWNADAQVIIREMLIEAIEATALRSPVTPSPSREEVARIIDPTAWKMEDGYLIEQSHSADALAKADAILALSQAQPEPVAVPAGHELCSCCGRLFKWGETCTRGGCPCGGDV